MTSVVFRRDATRDLEEAYAWYEAQKPGLGEDFRDALDVALDFVTENPLPIPCCTVTLGEPFYAGFRTECSTDSSTIR